MWHYTPALGCLLQYTKVDNLSTCSQAAEWGAISAQWRSRWLIRSAWGQGADSTALTHPVSWNVLYRSFFHSTARGQSKTTSCCINMTALCPTHLLVVVVYMTNNFNIFTMITYWNHSPHPVMIPLLWLNGHPLHTLVNEYHWVVSAQLGMVTGSHVYHSIDPPSQLKCSRRFFHSTASAKPQVA